MSILRSRAPPLPSPPPEDISVPQFLLGYHHPLRPVRKNNIPWLVEVCIIIASAVGSPFVHLLGISSQDITGKAYYYEEVAARTFGFANALYNRWKLSWYPFLQYVIVISTLNLAYLRGGRCWYVTASSFRMGLPLRSFSVCLVAPNLIGAYDTTSMIKFKLTSSLIISDYPIAIWGVHRLGGIVACVSPFLSAFVFAIQYTHSPLN